MEIRELVEQEYEAAVERRHYIHRHPELSFQEYKTTDYIQKLMEEWGIPYERLQSGTGLAAWLTGEEQGRTIAFRADIDALPIVEDTGLPFASENEGVMHGCGHDMHTANLLGFAHILSTHRELVKGKVKFLFQPAEELFPGGSRSIIGEGYLDDVDAIYGLHVRPGMLYNEVSAGKGGIYAGSTVYKIRIKGKGGHGSAPSTAVDPIVAAAGVVNALQTIVSRNVNPLDALVVSTCIIRSGSKGNIIPEDAYLEGQFRCYKEEVKDLAIKRIRQIAESISEGYGCSAEVTFEEGYAPVTNHDENVDVITAAIQKIGDIRMNEQPPQLGGEDFGYYLRKTSGAFFNIGLQSSGEQEVVSLHNAHILMDDRALRTGMEVFLGIYFEECGR